MGVGAEPSRRAWTAVGLLAVLVLGAWLGRLDLLDPDEGRHAEIAREMLADGSFLTPRLQGQPYHHKPVIFHWTVAAALAAFGPHAAAARLPSLLAALLVLSATGLWASRVYSTRVAVLAVCGLLTTPFFVAIGRLTTLDMLFCATLTAALAWLGCWLADPQVSRRSIYTFYIAVGLATLVKGPAAIVLCGAVAAAAATASGRFATFAELKPIRGGLLTLSVALPWYLAAWQADPAYIEEFLLRHNLARYAGGGDIGHQSDWWYYPAFAPLILLPWTPIVTAAVVRDLRRLRKEAAAWARLYCLLWAAVVIAFFAPASTKLVTYLLPAFPPLAVLGAAYASELLEPSASGSRIERWLGRYALGWSILIAAAAAGICVWSGWHEPAVLPRMWIALPALLLPLWLRRRLADRTAPGVPLAALAASSLAVILLCYGSVADLINAGKSSRPAAAIVRAELPADADLASFRCFQHALAFYAGRTVRKARSPEEALAGLRGPGPAALLTKQKHFALLGLDPLPPEISVRWRGGPGCSLLWKAGSPTDRP